MAGMAGRVPLNPHAVRPQYTKVYHFLRDMKHMRSEKDTDDSCCFDVDRGDRVSVVMKGSVSFVPVVVTDVYNGFHDFEYSYFVDKERHTGRCYYDEFNKTWKFGWDETRRSQKCAVELLKHNMREDCILKHLLLSSEV
jgi:hypothetical protein